MEKSKLAKLALTALAIASTLPAAAQANDATNSGTFLAAGCSASGKCSGARSNVSYNTPTNSNPYNASTNAYQATDAYGNPVRQSTTSEYNTNRGYNTSPNYTDSYRSEAPATDWSNSNRSYSTTTGDVDTRAATVSETDFQKQLNPQAKAIFLSLDSTGRSEAIQLAASQNQDKNEAVKEAQRRMMDRKSTGGSYNNNMRTNTRSGMSNSTSDYNR
ncbi:MAG: hypothetical protein H0W88_09820 [Parachlamydiaceae bacterium]|nr:hypothetical protein [Parachlamydiaceae bacterium]